MNNQQIHAVLANKVPAINDVLSCINHGGCGWSALALHTALKGHGIDSSIVLVAECGYTTKSVDRLIKRTGTEDINSAYQHIFKDITGYGGDTLNGHMCIKFDGRLYDSNGEYDGHAISEHITVEVMKMFLTFNRFWNGTFRNANRHNTDLAGTIQSFYTSLLFEHLGEGYEDTY